MKEIDVLQENGITQALGINDERDLLILNQLLNFKSNGNYRDAKQIAISTLASLRDSLSQ